MSREGFQSDLMLLDEATRFRAIHALVPEDLTIPGEVWTAFLEQEYQLDQDHPGDVTLSAVVGELLRLMQEAKEK